MLEGVLKGVCTGSSACGTEVRFNPWYVGGGVKSNSWVSLSLSVLCFNPWYVGGGVKSAIAALFRLTLFQVSILGMLEGVLKGD